MNTAKYYTADEIINSESLTIKDKLKTLAAFLKPFDSWSSRPDVDTWVAKKHQCDSIERLFERLSMDMEELVVFADKNNHVYIENRTRKRIYGLTEIYLDHRSHLSSWLPSISNDLLDVEISSVGGTGWYNDLESYNDLNSGDALFDQLNNDFGYDRSFPSYPIFYDHLLRLREKSIPFRNEEFFDESLHDRLLYYHVMVKLLEVRPWKTTLDLELEENRGIPKDESTWYNIHCLGTIIETKRIFDDARNTMLPSDAVDFFYDEVNRLYKEAVNNRMPEYDYQYDCLL